MTKTTKFMKQSGSQGDSERRHDGSRRRAGEQASVLGWTQGKEKESGSKGWLRGG